MNGSKYLKWVRTLQCCRCPDQTTPTEAHHLRGVGHMSGVGMKAPDWAALPLCKSCHAEFHAGKWPADAVEMQPIMIMHTLKEAFECGAVKFGKAREW